ncbi:PPOX class F420-dependent enzyme [Actinoplanes philippinensis]|uniref:PPOX class probable F420-dependent enzyme n=1 Tax=Actinoplanes philippinensis TaxID=35752 RepID=A0A1I2GSU3_9ACTN|nr:TIGR03618 family F420-dependent PPOX class oxidoreductase [Actinoplanes philippinensis]GIE78011.1 PPOX class F420-dependent enzyme [Actinoplanes philippinensis]SFF19907.1 PPOX class probable F420-dependent enzyme [Actinoplanes philippinensis]
MDQKLRDLLTGPNFAHVATVRRDGSPSVTPTWVDLRDDLVLLNGMQGRGWPRNLIRDPRVTVSVTALGNPYECATLRGHALAPTTDDAEEHFRHLFRKYRDRTLPTGGDNDPQDNDMPGRILFRVVIESAHYQWQPPPGATEEYDAFLAEILHSPAAGKTAP